MEDKMPTGDTVEKMFLAFQSLIEKELNTFRVEDQKRFENQMIALRSELRSVVEPLQKQIEDQHRDLGKLALDVKIVREHERREAGIGLYRRKQIPPDTETDGNGHSSYPWRQKIATPRPG